VIGLYGPAGLGAELTSPFSAGGKGKYANKPIIILGGASSVGQAVIQIGKLSGFSPIITTASLKHTGNLKSLGATHVLDRSLSTAELKLRIEEITSSPVELVYDSIGESETENTGYDLLSEDGGKLILVNLGAANKGGVIGKKQIIKPFGIFNPNVRELGKEFYSQLSRLVEAGDIKVSFILDNCVGYHVLT
jgi:NADPH:quinone reductase-like Zn-dependent oxidoreductase